MTQKRNFYCDFPGDQCDDPRCKKGRCWPRLEALLPDVIKTVLEKEGRHPTKQDIAKLCDDQQFVARLLKSFIEGDNQ